MSPMSTPSRLSGHTLRYEGAAIEPVADATGRPDRLTGDRQGSGLCSCGETSESLPSDAARKRWHADHKQHVRSTAAHVLSAE